MIDDPKGGQVLFNLAKDIGEKNDLAAENGEQVTRLKRLLDWWETDVTPPLYPLNVKAAATEETSGEKP